MPYHADAIRTARRLDTHVQPPVSLSKDERWLSYLFVEVLPKTDFNGRASSFAKSLQSLVGASLGLHHACIAFSAMFAYNHAGTRYESRSNKYTALQAYQSALTFVRISIEEPSNDLLPTLCAVFLLSVFEVSQGSTWNCPSTDIWMS